MLHCGFVVFASMQTGELEVPSKASANQHQADHQLSHQPAACVKIHMCEDSKGPQTPTDEQKRKATQCVCSFSTSISENNAPIA